jgi:hypothetical protein
MGELLTGGGKCHSTAGAGKEWSANVQLELSDLTRQRWLGDVQRGGGPPEVQPLGHGDEVSELA